MKNLPETLEEKNKNAVKRKELKERYGGGLAAKLWWTLCDPMDWSPPGCMGSLSKQEYWRE